LFQHCGEIGVGVVLVLDFIYSTASCSYSLAYSDTFISAHLDGVVLVPIAIDFYIEFVVTRFLNLFSVRGAGLSMSP
jgi:hypothetical protein